MWWECKICLPLVNLTMLSSDEQNIFSFILYGANTYYFSNTSSLTVKRSLISVQFHFFFSSLKAAEISDFQQECFRILNDEKFSAISPEPLIFTSSTKILQDVYILQRQINLTYGINFIRFFFFHYNTVSYLFTEKVLKEGIKEGKKT